MNKAEKHYRQLLKNLKSLIKARKDESEKGEALRQKMDKLWPFIPENKRRKINKNVKLPKIRVIYKEISAGIYRPEYKCPPHVGYYAGMIMHWRCEFCGKLEHEKPKNWLTSANIESVYPDE